MRTHYEMLGLDKDFNAEDIKQSYRERAKDFHPDRFVGDHISEQEAIEAHQEMTVLNEAYRVLSDPELRARYDQELEFAKQQAQASSAYRQAPRAKAKKPFFTWALISLVIAFSIFVIVKNTKAPNKHNFREEFQTAKTVFKPQVDQALKGNLPSLKETMEQPEGLLLKRALSPELSPQNCLNAFPNQLQPK